MNVQACGSSQNLSYGAHIEEQSQVDFPKPKKVTLESLTWHLKLLNFKTMRYPNPI